MKDVSSATEILRRRRGELLSIKKREKEIRNASTSDYVELHLEKISLRDSDYIDGDNYVADQELILHGPGRVHSDKGKFPLPQNAYEIPLIGDCVVTEHAQGMKITTQRAEYNISY